MVGDRHGRWGKGIIPCEQGVRGDARKYGVKGRLILLEMRPARSYVLRHWPYFNYHARTSTKSICVLPPLRLRNRGVRRGHGISIHSQNRIVMGTSPSFRLSLRPATAVYISALTNHIAAPAAIPIEHSSVSYPITKGVRLADTLQMLGRGEGWHRYVKRPTSSFPFCSNAPSRSLSTLLCLSVFRLVTSPFFF